MHVNTDTPKTSERCYLAHYTDNMHVNTDYNTDKKIDWKIIIRSDNMCVTDANTKGVYFEQDERNG
jgi:hypothetical protein